MPDMKSSWDPKRYPVRKPTDLRQGVGRVINPPRTQKAGGVGEANLLPLDKTQSKVNIAPDGKGPVSDQGKGGRK
jgi:hypothetical protein